MEGISEGLNTKSLTISSLFTFEMIFNSTTCDCISSSLACLIFSLSSNSCLSFSAFAFLRLSSLAFSSSSLFFLSFISFSSCSLLAQSFSSSSFSLFFSNSRSFWNFACSLLYFSVSLFVHSRENPNYA